MILIGQDIKEQSQYLPFITEQKNIDFVVYLNNGYYTESIRESIASQAKEIKIPILYVNTGQFGGTGVYQPEGLSEKILKGDYTEGMVKWERAITESLEKSNRTSK